MKVYIYKPKGTEFADDWLYAAWKGFNALGANIIFFERVENIPYAPDNVVVAYIEDTKDYFHLHNIAYPKPLNVPQELKQPSYLGRDVISSMLITEVEKDIKDGNLEVPIFVKPADAVKGCASGILYTTKTIPLLGASPFDNVFVSEVVDFISEYRCFIHEGELVGIKHYTGSFQSFPDTLDIQEMVLAYKEAPIAYTLDVGVVRGNNHKEETFLVECNDFWSICNYGLDPVIYAKMLRDRWFELTKYGKYSDQTEQIAKNADEWERGRALIKEWSKEE